MLNAMPCKKQTVIDSIGLVLCHQSLSNQSTSSTSRLILYLFHVILLTSSLAGTTIGFAAEGASKRDVQSVFDGVDRSFSASSGEKPPWETDDLASGKKAFKDGEYWKALKLLRPYAEGGDVEAQWILGEIYSHALNLNSGTPNVRGVPRDLDEAAMWYRKAAKQGNQQAIGALALMYLYGLGPKDAETAKELRSMAEQYGSADAEFRLGAQLSYGLGVPEDAEEAAKWLKKAALQDHAEAQLLLGQLYQEGRGVKMDQAMAVKLYRASANQGVALAQMMLGICYASGAGVAQSNEAAIDWTYKAGKSFLRDGKMEMALARLEFIQEISPDHFLVGQLRNEIYNKENRPSKDGKVVGEHAQTFGTGWPVKEGYVVTSAHVVSGSDDITLLRADGQQLKASVVAQDPVNDLVILLPSNPDLLPKAFTISDALLRAGDEVFTIGYPHPDVLGNEPKLTNGIISAATGIGGDPRLYQISTPVQGGNSGGPLFNTRGEVVGIVESKLSDKKMFEATGEIPQNVNYAVKVAYLSPLLHSVLAKSTSIEEIQGNAGSMKDIALRLRESVMIVIAK
ncbi:MAG: SEL1-like repeat protein [Thiogranum sp.]|nr:SEL1-like repeat protein [Thiogranum sp.]